MSTPEDRDELPLRWVDIDEVTTEFANQFVAQFQRNEFVLTFGQTVPPALLGTPEQIVAQVREIPFVPVRPVVRVGMNRERLVECIAALQACLDNHDRAIAGSDPTHPGFA